MVAGRLAMWHLLQGRRRCSWALLHLRGVGLVVCYGRIRRGQEDFKLFLHQVPSGCGLVTTRYTSIELSQCVTIQSGETSLHPLSEPELNNMCSSGPVDFCFQLFRILPILRNIPC